MNNVGKKRLLIFNGDKPPHRIAWYGEANAESIESTIKKVKALS